eukprot:CAMPEP_0194129416 /NCGR_PEP_ID=MMETSP0152-20130528/651_1 /TAXON_ID=1049557 /ORGANISM="Thalassiothrix antarctica, Strain L6-D1" /LENGTH=64 /DNA_ID=CAMNT_0038823601 /DNA_START=138 /DNA_END=332 /DNA_ORIENTATION=-
MGCGQSKRALTTVDDSVHVMLKHDKKIQQKKGEVSHGFVQRAPFPNVSEEAGDKPSQISAEEAK